MKKRRINATLAIAALALTAFLVLTAMPWASTASPRLQAKLDTFSCDTVTEIPQAECEALVALYNSTNGASWSNNSGWMDTNTPCSWYGITCSTGHVTQLYLGDNQLSGNIPPELGNLTNLQDLDLEDNQLSGSIPPELGNLANLQNLFLGMNQLSGSIPPQLGNLTNLQHLWLSDNQLGGSIPPELGNLTNLAWLILFNNQLSGSIPTELSDLVSLETLDLGYNQLSGSIPTWLGNLADLQHLILRDNQLSGSIPTELGNITDLQVLSLRGNQLSGSIPTWLDNLASLWLLDLSSDQLSGSIPPELGNLTNLEWLYLGHNQLSGSIPPQLGNLTNLRSLNLWGNQLSGSIPPQLGNLTNLQSLSLGGNQLSGSIPLELGSLANLQYFRLDNNQLTGSIPPELGNLVNLQDLRLNSNQFSGALPGSLTNLTNLDTFWFHDTDLCEPADAAFQAWLASISNLSSTGVICCVLPGDLDGDSDVDVEDIMLVANCWRMTTEDPECAPYDLNGDGIINIVDIMLVVKHWGDSCKRPFEDDFEDGNANDWEVEMGWWICTANWEVVLDNGNFVYGPENGNGGLSWYDASWSSYTYEARIKFPEGASNDAAIIFLWENKDNWYGFRVKDGLARIFGFINGGEHDGLATASVQINTNQWYSLKAVIQGNTVRAYLDDDFVLEYNGLEWSSGAIGLQNDGGPLVYFDDIKVTIEER